ncbi:MAG TPA: Uma2 family endonuclease [Blastocatellia bacterium]|nr:Uma2 family endonuclease [Blastocatellia bacterium]HMV81656.1 Uma2 family endonuclease [Blastocatellia bacterium]HMX26549.1 Uma2 family endonuclease [Blastocatellia bacterium]HMY74785.1 Uma2 family endonuclease [Blastocatellia bacterium]HMZ20257.1 Uma2 family endonuclease [Blastocatellia bacterium]
MPSQTKVTLEALQESPKLPTMYDLYLYEADPEASDLVTQPTLPTMYDLPSEEIGDAGMPDEFHVHQAILLDETFRPTAVVPNEVFSAVDMNLYYDWRHPLWYKRPDWFAVVGVPRLYENRDSRLSYVCWQEGQPPLLVVELLSPGTEKEDLGQSLRDAAKPPPKWEVYERILRVPYYVVFSRETDEPRIFRHNGTGYEEVADHGGRFWIASAGLGLGVWQGTYRGQDRLWLRWYDPQGNWILSGEEERYRAEEEHLRAKQERLRAERAEEAMQQERLRAERMAELLRQLGHDPDQL